jgi:hypothetical protein
MIDKILDEVIPAIAADPSLGEILKGSWSPSQSYHFHRRPEYRIIYRVYHCNAGGESPTCSLHHETDCSPGDEACGGVINFILLGTREEFNRFYKMKRKDIDRNNL